MYSVSSVIDNETRTLSLPGLMRMFKGKDVLARLYDGADAVKGVFLVIGNSLTSRTVLKDCFQRVAIGYDLHLKTLLDGRIYRISRQSE